MRTIYSIVSLACLLAFTGCMTSRNAQKIESYRNPATELRARSPSVCHGFIRRTDSSYTLVVNGLFSSGKNLVLTFPAEPTANHLIATAQIVETTPAPSQDGAPVEIEIVDGSFDNSIRIEDKMVFSDGKPGRLTLGVFWNLRETYNLHVIYTVGYKYSPDQRFVTAACDAELPWMTRSHATTTGYCFLYIFTVPLDVVTSPFQLIGYALAPKWQD